IHQENRERAAARNAGVAASRAPLVAFLDSDDAFHPNHLREIAGVLRDHPEVGVAYHSAEIVDEESGEVILVVPRHPTSGRVLHALAQRNGLPLSATVVRRSLLETVGGFDEDRALSGAE